MIVSTAGGQPLGRIIAQRRQELGLSQRELADRICALSGASTVTRHELSRYERGVRTPSHRTLVILARSLDMPVAVLSRVVSSSRRLRRDRGSELGDRGVHGPAPRASASPPG